MYKIALKALNQEVDQWEGPIAEMDDKSCFVRNRRDKAKARAACGQFEDGEEHSASEKGEASLTDRSRLRHRRAGELGVRCDTA